MKLFILTWVVGDKEWESERYSVNARSALAQFKDELRKSRITMPVTVTGVREYEGTMSLQLVA